MARFIEGPLQKVTLKKPVMKAYSKCKIANENFDPNLENDAPSPLDFVSFFPWICQKLALENVFVIKLLQESYTPLFRQKAKKPAKIIKSASSTSASDYPVLSKQSAALGLQPHRSDEEYTILIQAYHNASDRLVELCVKNCNIITQKHIKALSLCMPFHSLLSKINFSRCSLYQEVLYEMGNLLSESKVTELCLDDTFCEQGNYFMLLEYASSLKRLSINRCKINDAIVQKIFSKLCAGASKTLQILEISSNFITDKGALMIGKTLRMNRVLIHLNLAGNRITDKGLAYIMNSLMEFQLTDDEIIDKKKRNMNFIKRKMRVYEGCFAEQLRQRQRQLMSLSNVTAHSSLHTKTGKSTIMRSTNTPKHKKLEFDINIIAAKQTQQIMGGPFTDAFDDDHVRCEDGKFFCKGNFKFTSINLAYNNLTHMGMKTVLKVLEYQTTINTAANKADKGLMRIIVDGNNLCESCVLLDNILYNLKKKMATLRADTNLKSNVLPTKKFYEASPKKDK